MDDNAIAEILKVMGDKHRIAILKRLKDGEKSASEILNGMDIGQPTLSHHMQFLCRCGIVKSRRDGKWVRYSIDRDLMDEMRAFLADI